MSTFEKLSEIVCDVYDINMSQLISRSRKRELCLARNMLAYIVFNYLDDMKIHQIGKLLNRDRSTVWHSLQICMSDISSNNYAQKEYYLNIKYRIKTEFGDETKDIDSTSDWMDPEIDKKNKTISIINNILEAYNLPIFRNYNEYINYIKKVI